MPRSIPARQVSRQPLHVSKASHVMCLVIVQLCRAGVARRVRAGVHNLSDNGLICKLIARPAAHGSAQPAPPGISPHLPRTDCGGPRALKRRVARGVDIPPTTPCKAGRQGTRFAIGGRRCRTDGKGGRRAKRRRPPLRQALSWVRAQEGAISRRPFQDVCDERCA